MAHYYMCGWHGDMGTNFTQKIVLGFIDGFE